MYEYTMVYSYISSNIIDIYMQARPLNANLIPKTVHLRLSMCLFNIKNLLRNCNELQIKLPCREWKCITGPNVLQSVNKTFLFKANLFYMFFMCCVHDTKFRELRVTVLT